MSHVTCACDSYAMQVCGVVLSGVEGLEDVVEEVQCPVPEG